MSIKFNEMIHMSKPVYFGTAFLSGSLFMVFLAPLMFFSGDLIPKIVFSSLFVLNLFFSLLLNKNENSIHIGWLFADAVLPLAISFGVRILCSRYAVFGVIPIVAVTIGAAVFSLIKKQPIPKLVFSVKQSVISMLFLVSAIIGLSMS